MATRFYLQNTLAAAVPPPFDPVWDVSGEMDRRRLVVTAARPSSVLTNKAVASGTVPASDVLIRQYVSDPLSAQTVTGTIKGIIRALENSSGADARSQVVIKIVSGDGATVRGTLLSASAAALTNEWGTALANRKFPLGWSGAGASLGSVAAQSGDRLVVEIGARAENPAAVARTLTLNFGDSAGTDLVEDETSTTANDPWVEFSQTLTFASAAAGTITVTSPTEFRTYQRGFSTRTADIAVAGTYTGTPGAGGIEASWNGGAWVAMTTGGGTFSGTLTGQSGGQGSLRVRFADDTSVNNSVPYVGVGEVFVIFGQSNAGGRLTNNQLSSHATLRASMLGNDYVWKELFDPTDSRTSQVDTVSQDTSAPAGSVWPLVATQLMASLGVPVAFIPCAMGATGISAFKPGADHFDRATLYGSMNYRVGQVGGARAVLWWQGETDAQNSVARATYNADLDTIANAIATDRGIKLIPCKLQNCTLAAIVDDPAAMGNINGAIGDAWADNANVVGGVDFTDLTDGGDGLHIKSDADALTAATRWVTVISANYVFSATAASSPRRRRNRPPLGTLRTASSLRM